MAELSLIERLFDVIEHDIVPKTTEGVTKGNKLFGAALLAKDDRSLVLAETNNELENPLWHGEMHCLKRFYEMPKASRADTKDLIFLSTHEPCSLCLSAITWAGFDNFYYLFSHEDSRDSFAIPHDLKILKRSSRWSRAATTPTTPTGRAFRYASWSANYPNPTARGWKSAWPGFRRSTTRCPAPTRRARATTTSR